MSPQVPSLVIIFASSVGLTVLAAVVSLGEDWVWPDANQTGLIILSALFIFAGYCTSVMVMRVGVLSAVTPFRYTSLRWALLLGWLVFGEWQPPLTFFGVIIIAATGCYTLYRKARISTALLCNH